MYFAKAAVLLWIQVVLSSQVWEDSDTLSRIWSACSMHDSRALLQILDADKSAAQSRSSDGRGPLFWAYEFGHTEAIKMLEGLGADSKARDANGKTPIQLGIENSELNLQRSFPYATTLSGQTSQGYNSDHFDEDDDYDDEDDEF